MTGEFYQRVVMFAPLSPGRESIMLGRVQVGEISPTMHPSSRHPTCFRLDLPGVSSRAWHPSRSIEDARRLAAQKINDWLNAAGVMPVGGCE
jgi:hypothetical protein